MRQLILLRLLAIACSVMPASAQILYGGLLGNVTDKSDAAVSLAEITITNEQTGAIRTSPLPTRESSSSPL